MNDFRYDPIKPADVPLSRPTYQSATEPPPPPHWRALPWMWMSLTALILLALTVVFLLPRWIDSDWRAAENDSSSASAQPSAEEPPAAAEESVVPQDDARQTAARREAQTLLTRLMALQQELEQVAVTYWAPTPYEQARALIAAGDHHYRQRDFVAALEQYQQAAATLTGIADSRPEHLQQALQAGRAALEAGDAEAAAQHFERALLMDPGNAEALQAKARLEQLPAVLAALEKAADLEHAGDLAAALAAFEDALALDPHSSTARQGQERLRQMVADQRYQDALDRGFAALQGGDDAGARQAFREALSTRPDDEVARSGLAQAEERAARRRIVATLERARTLEQQENWAEAAEVYEGLYRDDASLVDARVGQMRAATRARLDQEMEQLLADPLRLGSDAVLAEGRELLADARAIAQPGPRLSGQIAALDEALQHAATPVSVTLRSDNRTHVTVLRVADLGTVQSTELSLRPGRYVATGSRSGYRDVRVEFEVPLGSAHDMVVTVICDEPIGR